VSIAFVTNDGLVYDAIFRHYRNAFVDHLRSCLITNFGNNACSELTSIFDSEWNRIIERNQISESAGSVTRDRVDEFDYLDIAYFERIVDHFYDYIVSSRWRGSNAAASKRCLINWIREVKNVRDPTAHPGSGSVDLRDAIRAVDTARRVLGRLDVRDGDQHLTAIWDELVARATRAQELGSAAPLDDSLPRRETIVEDFVGRTTELQQLRAFLNNPHKKRWLLVGDGGKGKTAIAYTFAREVIEASPSGLCAVFWLSAKRRKYQLDRVVDIPNPDFSTLTECVDRLLVSYGHHDALEFPAHDREEQLLMLLDELPVLLVVDDLDSVTEENEDVIEFLTLRVPQTESNVLFTSRRPFTGMGKTLTRVSGLPKDDALQFVESRWEGEGLGRHELGMREREKVVEICEGSPLYMGDLLRLIASVAARTGDFDPAQVIGDWCSQEGDTVRRYALQREMDMLTVKARRVLEAMAIAGRLVTVEEIAVLTALSEQVVTTAVDELRQLYLLTAPALEEDVPRFQLDGNLAILVRTDLADTPREKELVAARTALDGKEQAVGQATPIRDITRQARLLIDGKRLAEAERLLRRANEEYPANPHLLALLGFVYIDWQPRRNADARRFFARAAQLRHKDRGMFLAWNRIERESGNWRQAVEAAETGLQNRGQDDPMLMHAAARSYLGMAAAFKSAFHPGKAKEAYASADATLDSAIKEAKDLRLRSTDISVMYREWVRSARQQRREKAVCTRISMWERWRSSDRDLRLELAEHSGKCETGVHSN
jgi:tetratricopeptide (TPR) repeat protein